MNEQSINQPTQNNSAQRPSAVKKAVLIIDDERQVRETIEDVLNMESVAALSAANGEEGVALYAANQAQIGVIILDLSMPGMSGIDTFTALRAVNPAAKIILSSGYSEPDTLKKLENLNPSDFLHKPYRLDAVLRLIEQHLT